MSSEQNHSEREWEADKRDFVADWRDAVAAARDAAADARDAVADEREQMADDRETGLDERERTLDEHAEELGIPSQYSAPGHDRRAADNDEAATRRRVARHDREQRHDERELATAEREAASKRRLGNAPVTGLAKVFAEIARYLYEADNFEEVLVRILGAAVSTISGCDMASITVREGEQSFRTLASSDQAATAVDEAQYAANEGPCLDAIAQPIVHASSFPDSRWPALASRPADSGVEAIASFRLAAESRVPEDSIAGSLNAYAGEPEAFDDEAQEIGLILASHASVGIGAVRERESLELFGRQLHEALSSRDVIGQAKGMLMERLRISPEEAFDTLRRASQQLNIKLREVAEKLAETTEFDDPSEH